ncbi:MAG: FHA domain-containing protein [Planctomycetaceae bacterium]|nr:FHA domain-containing protein [Planctomycetaceae bacterium]
MAAYVSTLGDKTTLDHATANGPLGAGSEPLVSLVLYHRSGAKVVPLGEASNVVVGRRYPADVVVDDLSLSRQHARFVREGAEVWVEDLGSTNGVRINGQRTERARVGLGDEVAMGAVTAVVQVLAPKDQLAEGLEPGEHIATLSLRARPCESALAIATARFLVHAGERTEVRLERLPATPSADPLVRLEFLGDTRFLRDGAGAVSVRKRIGMGWSDSQALSFRPDSAETEPTRMEPGAFELTVTGAAAFRRTFEVLGATDQLVLIELASLRRIRVSLDAGAASSELLPRTLRWCRVEDRANENRVHSRGSELGTFELLSASLPIELWLYDERQLRFAEGQRVRIEQDGDVRVRMVENPRLTLRFVDDQRRFHAPRYASVFTRFCPGGNELALAASIGKDSSGSIDEVRVWFPEAGAYELELPEFEGFESLAPLSVHVIADAVPMFEVPLVRKR